jgi:lysine/arginine/ornithine transport system substrate-binding protein
MSTGHSDVADVTIAMDPTYPPFSNYDAWNGLTGFDVELLPKVCEAAGITCAVVTTPFKYAWPGHEKAFMGEGFLKHQFDCYAGSGNTMPRRTTLRFSDPTTKEMLGAYVGLAGQKMFEDPSTVHIGTIEGYSCGTTYVKRTMPTIKNVSEFPSPKAMFAALSARTIDVALTCPVAAAEKAMNPAEHKILDTVGGFNDGLAFMCHPQSAAKIAQLNRGLKKVKEDGTMEALCKRYPTVRCDFDRTFDSSNGGVDSDAKASQIVIAMEASYAPFNFFDPVKGLIGFDTELVPLVCEAADVSCAVVTVPFKRGWPGHEDAFTGEGFLNNEFDCFAASGNTAPRRATLKFSNPYTEEVTAAFVGKKGTLLKENGEGAIIGTVMGFSCGKTFVQRTMPKAFVTEFATTTDLFKSLETGWVQTALTCPVANAKQRMNHATHEIIKTVTGFNDGLAFMCHPGEAPKIAALNAGLQKLRESGKLEELCKKYPDIECDVSGREFDVAHGGVDPKALQSGANTMVPFVALAATLASVLV